MTADNKKTPVIETHNMRHIGQGFGIVDHSRLSPQAGTGQMSFDVRMGPFTLQGMD